MLKNSDDSPDYNKYKGNRRSFSSNNPNTLTRVYANNTNRNFADIIADSWFSTTNKQRRSSIKDMELTMNQG